ncbi:MAG: hydroxymethylglutaryl-CoA lyase [Phycisphaeraceae bacterium]|nr:hydroxymethylglutaryl-CoA lyase [Phycisphaeraceae bacterium]
MPEQIRITDVSPRDGLQNEDRRVPTSEKVALVRALCAAGVDEVEVSSFVSAAWIPQLGDAAEVFSQLAGHAAPGRDRPVFSALVPNRRGMDAAIEVNRRAGIRVVDKVSVFTAASETFARRNTNATIAETIERFIPVSEAAAREGMPLRAYISCVVACPFEGAIDPGQVAKVIGLLAAVKNAGRLDEIDLGDTVGAATPDTIVPVIRAARRAIDQFMPGVEITLHLHDTNGQAGASVAAALREGIRSFDGSAGGLGGCPYASTPGHRAPGNIATRAIVDIARVAGFETPVDDRLLDEASRFARALVGFHAAE